ncbi:acetyl-CoA carboxylase biotin carboxyl carrier protein [Candidatus Enterococcus ferrettii]|uniref:Biotin carboxyl carrier protein of acetyl-CoA carboxylase n=1 Tax=Candidatus Enterococcus ferrettii TaxID=2815324 RepID=A0ABV0EYV1_9ENTE|nr:acetyl-CoA carboxylase biotin carboxyl carrier protein [Enterococcus sp. 665A]MBO1339908.1 acetyl-CoA carboxylase biotin carboxyl carrier protein [Enterococcus sp. 665A]
MDIKEVKELMEQFDRSSLTEFDLHEGSFELYMNKNKGSRQAAPTVEIERVAVDQPKEVVTAEVEVNETSSSAQPEVGNIISSPIVGVVYLQSSPDQPAFKEVGDSVGKGETVCIIEAMKLLNEVVSDFEGTIAEVLVENEDVVEYGQPLFRIN